MYHHRYQPPPHLANKTAASFASNNYSINSYPSSSPSTTVAANNNNNNNNNHTNNNSSSFSGIPNHIIEERQDVIFRKVRGILNKITPETFDKLSKELVNVGLDSPRTLRGVIYLLFDKALKDLKYSSLYAKLCQELSEKAPNFEQELGPNTFCKFLISKCEDEFERRRKATEDFDSKNELTDEEYEQKAIAKQKMLGNIKFICELGKKRLLQEEILHECIRGLLSKKKERPIQDQAQDLECLCQIMRTIGSLLDIQASRNLMNQYFDRIDLFSRKAELPSRIRFMLRDVIDLRNNNWRPRPFQREDNVPQPLSKLREEAGYDCPSANSTIDKFGNRNLIGISDLSKLHGNKLSMLLDDEPSFTTTTDFHWGPSFLPLDHPFDAFASNTTATATGAKHHSSSTKISGANTGSSSDASSMFHKSPPFLLNDPFSEPDFRRFDRSNFNSSSGGGGVASKQVAGEAKRGPEGFEKKVYPDTSNMRNDRDAKINTRHKAPVVVPPPRMQKRDDQLPPSFNTARRYGDSKQPPSIARGVANASPPLRQGVNERRNPNEPSYPAQPPPVQQQNYASRAGHNDAPDNRERKFHRAEHPEHLDRRQPRFSNNNYRQGRNERPINREHHYFDKSNHSESELNFNWRSGPSASSTITPANNVAVNTSPTTNMQKSSTANSNQFTDPRSGEGDDKMPHVNKAGSGPIKPTTNQINDIDRKFDDLYVEKRPSEEKGVVPPRFGRDALSSVLGGGHPRGPPLNSANHAGSQSRNQNDQPIIAARFADVRSPQVNQSDSTSPQRQVSRPSHEQSNQSSAPPAPASYQNYRHNHRNVHVDITDRKETQRKFYPSNSQEHEILPAKNSENNGVFQQERGYRAPINRNQQFDSAPIPESDRIPSWRRGVNIFSNNNSNNYDAGVKEQPSQSTNSLLPKPPSKVISDTNFSLRPSHNLGGRTTGVLNLPQTNPKVSVKVDQSSRNAVIKKEDSLERSSNSGNANVPSDGAQAAPRVPAQALKTGSTVGNEDKESKTESANASPTRSAARDFHVNKFISVLCECSNEAPTNLNRVATKIKELKVPKSYQHECLVSIMKQAIVKSESDRENAGKLFVQLVPSIFETSTLLSAFKVIFEQMHSLEVETPKVKSLVASFLSQAILDGLLPLDEVGNVLSGGKHHPLFLLVLQKLEKSAGQAWLNEKFIASKINFMDMLPEVDRSKDRLASILKDRCLGFLDPMLTVEPDLWEQMKERDSSPAAVYKWIKDNVDPAIQGTPTFAHVLISCLMKYINSAANESKSKTATGNDQATDQGALQSNKSSPSSSSQNSTSDIEKDFLTKYQQVLQAILKDKQMQLASLYALQSFYHGLDFPKGSLLRWFHMLYDMNIVDDDVFFTWKEEINDEFPGKGQALFQVNTWLNWLAEAESEEEDEEEEMEDV